MKIIFRILMILLAAAIVCGGYFLIGNNTTLASGPGGEGQRPAIGTRPEGQVPPADGTAKQRPEGTAPTGNGMERPQGPGEGGALSGAGLSEILIVIAKLAGITVAILIIEKGLSLLKARTLKTNPS
jgi:hypothetical protein